MDVNGSQNELFRKLWNLLYSDTGEKAELDDVESEAIERLYRASVMPELDHDRVFKTVCKRIRVDNRRMILRRVVRYAAAVVLPLGCVMAVYFLWNGRVVEGDRIESGYMRPENTVRLTLSTGKTVDLDGKQEGEFVLTDAVAIRQDSIRGIVYEARAERDAEVCYNTLDVPVAAEYRLRLADGTVVYMNSDSRLRYPEVFAKDERRVYLEGEAYFEVAKDADCPFKVVARNVEVRVLGTHFNVNAYPEREDVVTTLAEGRVRVENGKEQAELVPGEQAVASVSGLKVTEVDVREYVSWKDGLFIFSRLSLEEIMEQVYRWYGVKAVFFNEKVRTTTFTGVINKNLSVEELFRVIEKVVDVRFTMNKGNQVVITAR